MALLQTVQVALTDGRNGSGEMEEPISSSSKGKWTKRLDILYRDEILIQESSFARLFKCLPNLQIIVQRGKPLIINRSDARLSIFVVLPELVTRSLHVLDIKCQFDIGPCSKDAYPDAPSIIDAIGNQPLHTLKVFPVTKDLSFRQHAFLSSLECLDAPRHFTRSILASTCTTPKLTQITLSFGHDNELVSSRKCFARIGAGLGELQLQIVDPTHIQQSLRDVADLCPNLRNLIVPLDSLTVGLLSGHLPPVRNLGIHPRLSLWDWEWRSEQSMVMLWESICSKLMELIPEMPNLRIVRLLDELPYKGDPFVLKAVATSKILTQAGVRFEDWTGQIFHKD
ncbi:uncharacterized protein FOMMEDRAFT_153640 [Fomitiporia mediterranea MF3/22]|uniref:uncharacterized protein n=1 Tax=Fomitiporia mediterranea (strain MF3/22) TaxID=694068 RepID=UPI0004407C3D|nr:uncharacterized protein FOMMEDRAFT_153640 [Fomitiporia mediterranea MF3/22]EJD06238.1 hypothetical protein FOMMEDRAFT_153640 [Fomitiporia mediterranea MF3/22]